MRLSLSFLLLLTPLLAQAQLFRDSLLGSWRLSGTLQCDFLAPQADAAIGAPAYREKLLENSYLDLQVNSPYLDAGLRHEYLKHPLPGFEKDLQGAGISYAYVEGKYRDARLTLGSLYDQFGTGFIFRSYEDRSLGIDNQLRGARLALTPLPNLHFKALAGRQRQYWSTTPALIAGADASYRFVLSPKVQLTLGVSALRKSDDPDRDPVMIDAHHRLRLPQSVWASDWRTQLATPHWNILAEYAHKGQDPSFDNGYIYRQGHVALLSASYSRRGMSLLLQAKRSDNMGFRSHHATTGTSAMLNHLPPFTREQTYALQARYPYATHPNGEWAYQAEWGYKLKRNTPLGGKYGTDLRIGFSHIQAIEQQPLSLPGYAQPMGSEGYSSNFFKWGDETYYQNLDFQLTRRLSRAFKLSLSYAHLRYNQKIIEGKGDMLKANFFVADGLYKFSPKLGLRSEVQYASIRGDRGDWLYALAEFSIAHRWMISLSDMYNLGSTGLHYYLAALTYSYQAHRFQISYGRTNEGYNCSGGICRYTPATKGLSLSLLTSF